MLPSARSVWNFVSERGIRTISDHLCPHGAPCCCKRGRSCTCFRCIQATISLLHEASYQWGGAAVECDCRREANFNQLTPCCVSDDARCAGAGLLVCTRCRSLFGDTGLDIPPCLSLQVGDSDPIIEVPEGRPTPGLAQGRLGIGQVEGRAFRESPLNRTSHDDSQGNSPPNEAVPHHGTASTSQTVQLPIEARSTDATADILSDFLPAVQSAEFDNIGSVGLSEPDLIELDTDTVGVRPGGNGADTGPGLADRLRPNPYRPTTITLPVEPYLKACATGATKASVSVMMGIFGWRPDLRRPRPPIEISTKANTKFREAYHGNAARLAEPGPGATKIEKLQWSLYCHLSFEMIGRQVDSQASAYLKRKAESWAQRQKADGVVLSPEEFMAIFVEAASSALAPSSFDAAWEKFMRAEGDLGVRRLNLLRDGVKVQDFRWWERPLIPNWLRTSFPRWVEEKRQVRTKVVIPKSQ